MLGSIWINVLVAVLVVICIAGAIYFRKFYKKRMEQKKEYERLAKKAVELNRRQYIMKASRLRKKRR